MLNSGKKYVYTYKKHNVNIPKITSAEKLFGKGTNFSWNSLWEWKGFKIILSFSGQWSAFISHHNLLSLSQSLLKIGKEKENLYKRRQYKISEASPQFLMMITEMWKVLWQSLVFLVFQTSRFSISFFKTFSTLGSGLMFKIFYIKNFKSSKHI